MRQQDGRVSIRGTFSVMRATKMVLLGQLRGSWKDTGGALYLLFDSHVCGVILYFTDIKINNSRLPKIYFDNGTMLLVIFHKLPRIPSLPYTLLRTLLVMHLLWNCGRGICSRHPTETVWFSSS